MKHPLAASIGAILGVVFAALVAPFLFYLVGAVVIVLGISFLAGLLVGNNKKVSARQYKKEETAADDE